MRILVTNDDGIDSVGLHVLARAMRPYGDVTIGAPDSEYSGASAAFGAIMTMRPEIHTANVEGIDTAWSVSGPPALCVMFARIGAFGDPFDLVVSGINPGANVGRAVYHSGTVGAAITARASGITGIAVSQSVNMGSVMGQAWDDMIKDMKWESAAEVTAAVVAELAVNPLAEPGVLNINVPNLAPGEIKGVRRTEIGETLGRGFQMADVVPKEGHQGSFYVQMGFGEAESYPIETDMGAVAEGYVSLSWLSTYHGIDHPGGERADDAVAAFLGL